MLMAIDAGQKIGDVIWPFETGGGPNGIRAACAGLGIRNVGELKRWYFDDVKQVKLKRALDNSQARMNAVNEVVCACELPVTMPKRYKPTAKENLEQALTGRNPRAVTGYQPPKPKYQPKPGSSPLEKRMATVKTEADASTATDGEATPQINMAGITAGRQVAVFKTCNTMLRIMVEEGKDFDTAASYCDVPRGRALKWRSRYPEFSKLVEQIEAARNGDAPKLADTTRLGADLAEESDAEQVKVHAGVAMLNPKDQQESFDDAVAHDVYQHMLGVKERIQKEYEDHLRQAEEWHAHQLNAAAKERKHGRDRAEAIRQARLDVLEWMDDLSIAAAK